MKDLLTGDLAGLDTRAALPDLLAAIRGAGDAPLEPLLGALAERDPIALAEVVCGSRAPGGPRVARAALPHVATLERTLSPRGLYPRLIDLAGEAGIEVLAVACARHPAASWLMSLSRKVEPFAPGATHLLAAASHPSFAAVCHEHAAAGNHDALVIVAGETGRAEPGAALLNVAPHLAFRAAAAALDHSPRAPVVAHLAAVWGPDIEELLLRLIPLLRSRLAAEALLTEAAHAPRAARTLRAILPGMKDGVQAP